jgi:hypothetical protein
MRNAENGHSHVVLHPHDAASTPQRVAARGRVRYAVCLAFVMGLGVAACESSSSGTQVVTPVVLSMSSTVAPYYSSADLTIYWVQTPVSLPVRAGNGTEANVSPYPSAPYLLASDYLLQVDYTITNLDNTANTVWLTMDPWNQFVRYYPGITVVSDDETEPNLPGVSRPFVLEPMSRIEGTFTTDDMNDLATKLAIAMNIMTMPLPSIDTGSTQAELLNMDFNVDYRTNDGNTTSSGIALAPYIPSVIAGLTGFDLGLQSSSQMNVAVQINMQLVDNWTGPASTDPLISPGEPGAAVGPPGQLLKVPGAINM